ncbi:TatD family hydrolase [Parageobacillus toebii]|uniref:TatD family hydrolase n=1 Tax=Parageobacillus toebii TaxID=153151 RepID=UPI00296F6094
MKGSGLSMAYIDFHVHIDFYPNPKSIADLYEKNKIYTLFVTNLPELYVKHLLTFSNYKYIRLALGFHPQLVEEYELNTEIVNHSLETCRYIGEVGLDFYRETEEAKLQQIKVFEYLTQPIFNRGKVYSIHSRNADDTVLSILENNHVKHAVFHWYTGKLTTLNKIIDKGYYFSVNYKMLTTHKGKEIIKRLPKERILFETDGPFIRYKNRITSPADIENIYRDFEEVIPDFKNIVFTNFKRLMIEKDLAVKNLFD